jgi:hypothetical protein
MSIFALVVLGVDARIIPPDNSSENEKHLKISAEFPELQELIRDKNIHGPQLLRLFRLFGEAGLYGNHRI